MHLRAPPGTANHESPQYPEQKSPPQVYSFTADTTADAKNTSAEPMKRKIDSPAGRQIYSQRPARAESVFGNINSTHDMDRFTLGGRELEWVALNR